MLSRTPVEQEVSKPANIVLSLTHNEVPHVDREVPY